MPLVDYDSSSASEDEDQIEQVKEATKLVIKVKNQNEVNTRPAKRQRKLPSLPGIFDTGPKDDPSLHQGRKRTRPYVDGEYNAHVYLSLNIPSSLRLVLEAMIQTFQDEIPHHTIHSLLSSLHISLTHSLPLRRHQILPFRNSLADHLRSCLGFRLSFASEIKVYYNRSTNDQEGSGGRAFLALRVGAGAKELGELLDKKIHPLLEVIHAPKYHENPEFHTSFGWTLIDPTSEPLSKSGIKDDSMEHEDRKVQNIESDEKDMEENSVLFNDSSEAGFMDTPFPSSLLELINTKFKERILDTQPKGGWEIDSVHFKVAKEVHVLRLGI